ncbi:hypothetical protein [Alkaliphilus transvaalensis]|uniref:hypothetical protein n=1 Tax=Alkaliphilus transvaalensis TaxID=114628 RepID=UPI00047D063B|nr:hypothetical protein [Alkaliphilus transvaalensis]
MMKKLMACTCVLVILGSSGSFTYANQTNKSAIVREAKQLQVVTPERDESSTTNNKLVIEFTAPRETQVTILVYYNTSLEKDGENFTLGLDPITIEVGALQRGWAEVDLRRGTNKVEVHAIFKDGSKEMETRIVRVNRVEDVKKSLEDNKLLRSTTQILQGIAGNGKTQ